MNFGRTLQTLLPQPGIKLVTSVLGGSPNPWAAREVPLSPLELSFWLSNLAQFRTNFHLEMSVSQVS